MSYEPHKKRCKDPSKHGFVVGEGYCRKCKQEEEE